MSNNTAGRKGFVNTFMALFLVVLITLMAMLLSGVSPLFMKFVKDQTVSYQNYYYADLGIYRAKWLLKYITVTKAVPYNETLGVDTDDNGTTDANINITITCTADNNYTITSIANGKTITAKLESGKVVYWK